jgi:hypothetical protein
MTRLFRIVASSVAGYVAFAQGVLAGAGAYSVDPIVEDSGSDAGLILLVAVGALLVINALAPKTPPADSAVDAPDTTE